LKRQLVEEAPEAHKVKRTNFGPSQKEKAEPVGPGFIDDAELRVSSV
jgi:hypothetical protein